MDAKTLKRLEKAGWSHGDYGDFLGMTPEEKEIVEMRIAATKEINRRRRESAVSQAEMARRMGTKQPNVSRFLKNPGAATLDTLVRALLALGLDRRGVAATLAL